ncbi:unnamed protein product [marine sediment metagenome]|uniref:Uncharacterized protein n=1 Tax=marine sediment metagenome TaxID=412755 RepID=X0TDQ1_9ZZZZ
MSMSNYYDTLIGQIDNVTTCEQLADITVETDDIFTENLAGIQGSIDALAPLLISPSLNFTEIVEWIDKVIDTFSDSTSQLITLQTETLAKQAESVTALADKSIELDC